MGKKERAGQLTLRNRGQKKIVRLQIRTVFYAGGAKIITETRMTATGTRLCGANSEKTRRDRSVARPRCDGSPNADPGVTRLTASRFMGRRHCHHDILQ